MESFFLVFGVDPKITFFVPWALLQVQSSLQSFTEVKVEAIRALLVTVGRLVGEGQGILVCRRFERWRGDRGGLSSAPQSLPGLDRFACRMAPESFTTKKSTVRLRNNQTTPSQPVGKKISPGRISFGTDIQPSHHHLQSKAHHQ